MVSAIRTEVAAHPRLCYTPERIARIRRRLDTVPHFRAWYEATYRRAEAILALPVLGTADQPDGHFHRKTFERLSVLAFIAAISEETRFREALWQQAAAIAALDDWSFPSTVPYSLRSAEISTAMAMALDWHYDAWDEEQRRLLAEALRHKGLDVALATYRKPSGQRYWPDRDNNWNFVCNAGVICSALAVTEWYPDVAEAALTEALASLPTALRSFAPGGAWMEGAHYWHYGLLFLCLAVDALRTATGSDHGVLHVPGMRETGWFMRHMLGPRGHFFDFSDSSALPSSAPELFLLAELFNEPAYTVLAHDLIRFTSERETLPTADQLATDGVAAHLFDLIWYRDVPHDYEAPSRDAVMTGRQIEVGSLRSAWHDPEALWLAVKGGSAHCPHAHLDAGSFILEALGERWAIDLGGESYAVPGYHETWEGSPRRMYSYYRVRPEGHNTLVLDSWIAPQQHPAGYAKMGLASRNDEAAILLDLTACYAMQATRVRRGYALCDERRRVVIQDEVSHDHATEFYWFMHTRADITLEQDGRRARLAQNGKVLLVDVLAPAEYRFTVMDARPLQNSPDPEGQQRNEGIRKLAIHAQGAFNPTVAVCFTPLYTADDAQRPLPDVRPLDDWPVKLDQ